MRQITRKQFFEAYEAVLECSMADQPDEHMMHGIATECIGAGYESIEEDDAGEVLYRLERLIDDLCKMRDRLEQQSY